MKNRNLVSHVARGLLRFARNDGRIWAVFLFVFFSGARAQAIDALYLGGQVGYVKLSDNYGAGYSDAIGFGVDLGLKTSSIFDLTFGLQTSNHTGGISGALQNYRTTLSADIHVGQAYDFDFIVSAGPGFYSFSYPTVSSTKFGLNFGAAVDAVVDDHLRVGLGWKYHAVLGSDPTTGSLWQLMMRFGYLFDL